MKYKSLTFDEINRMDDVSLARLGDEMPDTDFQRIMFSHSHLRTKLRGPIEAKKFGTLGSKAFVRLGEPPILLLEPVVPMPIHSLGYGTPDAVGARVINGEHILLKESVSSRKTKRFPKPPMITRKELFHTFIPRGF